MSKTGSCWHRALGQGPRASSIPHTRGKATTSPRGPALPGPGLGGSAAAGRLECPCLSAPQSHLRMSWWGRPLEPFCQGGSIPDQSGRSQLGLSHSWGGTGGCERGHDCVTEGSPQKLESLVMKVEEETENAGLKLSIQKTKVMASGPITSWQTDVETVTDYIFLGSRITADGDCSLEIKRRLLLGRKVMTNLDSILKSRDIILPTKVCLVKAMFFVFFFQ